MASDRDNLEARVFDAELRVIDSVGALMEFWGFKRAMGRVWSMLYLSEQPASAAEIGERLSMSAGAVSTTVAELQKWGTIHRAWRPGERREFYEAETSIWKMVTRVFRERELTLVRDSAETFASAEATLAAAARGGDKELRRRAAFARERLGALRLVAQVGESIISAIVAGQSVDTTPLRSIAAATSALRRP